MVKDGVLIGEDPEDCVSCDGGGHSRVWGYEEVEERHGCREV